MLTSRFWQARVLRLRTRGAWARRRVQNEHKRDRFRATASAVGQARHVAATGLLTLALVVAIEAGAHLIRSPLGVHWPAWSSPIVRASLWLAKPVTLSNFDQLVATSVAVAATLLALYFATLGIIVSTSYTTAMPAMRTFVSDLPEGRMYVGCTIVAALSGLLALLATLLSWEPSRLLVTTSVLMSGFSLLAFARLGVKLFDFIEPAHAIPAIVGSGTRWFRAAQKQVGVGIDEMRMREYRQEFGRSLALLDEAARLVGARTLRNTQMHAEDGADARVVRTANVLARFWVHYSMGKQLIPANSGWYSPRERHVDWTLASDAAVSIALETKTAIRATAAPDEIWVERFLSRTIVGLLKERQVGERSAVLSELPDITRTLAAQGLFLESRMWVETLQRAGHLESESGVGPAQLAAMYNLADVAGLSAVNSVLGLGDYCRNLAADFPRWIVKECNGDTFMPLGRVTRAGVSAMRESLEFEKAVEGAVLTPARVPVQIVARCIATEVLDQLADTAKNLETEVAAWVDRVAKINPRAGSAALMRLYEALEKYEFHSQDIARLISLCEGVHKDIDDRWPSTTLEPAQERIVRLRNACELRIAALAARLDWRWTDDMPDGFGWAYTNTVDIVLRKIVGRDVQALSVTVPHLLTATTSAWTRLVGSVGRNHPHLRAHFISEPLVSLAQLSGIALVVSRVSNDAAVFAPFSNAWKSMLEKDATWVSRLTLGIVADSALVGLSANKVSRTRRVQIVERELEIGDEMGLFDDDREDRAPGVDPWVTLVTSHLGFWSYEEIFFADFFMRTEMASLIPPELRLPNRLLEMRDRLNQAEST